MNNSSDPLLNSKQANKPRSGLNVSPIIFLIMGLVESDFIVTASAHSLAGHTNEDHLIAILPFLNYAASIIMIIIALAFL